MGEWGDCNFSIEVLAYSDVPSYCGGRRELNSQFQWKMVSVPWVRTRVALGRAPKLGPDPSLS